MDVIRVNIRSDGTVSIEVVYTIVDAAVAESALAAFEGSDLAAR